jgi:hypothetical protein
MITASFIMRFSELALWLIMISEKAPSRAEETIEHRAHFGRTLLVDE